MTRQRPTAKRGFGGGAVSWEVPGGGTRGGRGTQGLRQLRRQNLGLWEERGDQDHESVPSPWLW